MSKLAQYCVLEETGIFVWKIVLRKKWPSEFNLLVKAELWKNAALEVVDLKKFQMICRVEHLIEKSRKFYPGLIGKFLRVAWLMEKLYVCKLCDWFVRFCKNEFLEKLLGIFRRRQFSVNVDSITESLFNRMHFQFANSLFKFKHYVKCTYTLHHKHMHRHLKRNKPTDFLLTEKRLVKKEEKKAAANKV